MPFSDNFIRTLILQSNRDIIYKSITNQFFNSVSRCKECLKEHFKTRGVTSAATLIAHHFVNGLDGIFNEHPN